MNEAQAYLNGRFIPASAAAIPVHDAGFVQGVTVSEQLRTFGGRLFRLEAHLDRLWESLEIVGIDADISRSELQSIVNELAARNHALLDPGDDLGLAILVTPGPYAGLSVGAPAGRTLCLHTYPLAFSLWAEKYDRGESLCITGIQQTPAECWPPRLKCRSRMHYFLADRRARAIDPAARALLTDAQGNITETANANVLVLLPGEGLCSPPRDQILPGITLAATCELAESLGLQVRERVLTANDLRHAEEILLTSTPNCVLPVTRFNGLPVGAGAPGSVFLGLLEAWNRYVAVDIAAQARQFSRR